MISKLTQCLSNPLLIYATHKSVPSRLRKLIANFIFKVISVFGLKHAVRAD